MDWLSIVLAIIAGIAVSLGFSKTKNFGIVKALLERLPQPWIPRLIAALATTGTAGYMAGGQEGIAFFIGMVAGMVAHEVIHKTGLEQKVFG